MLKTWKINSKKRFLLLKLVLVTHIEYFFLFNCYYFSSVVNICSMLRIPVCLIETTIRIVFNIIIPYCALGDRGFTAYVHACAIVV